MSLLSLVILLSALAADEVVELRVGATTPVAGTPVTVTFVGVTEDSRCPTGVTCIWEGDAVAELRVQTRADDAVTVRLHTNARFEGQAAAHGVTVVLERLQPHPKADTPVPAEAYVATVRLGAKSR